MIRLLAILLALTVSQSRAAEGYTIQDSTTNALVVVFIGDGWQSSERTGYLTKITNFVQVINAQTWVAGYTNRLKILAVFTNSPVSGITATAPNSDTPLGGYISGSSLRQDTAKLATIRADAGMNNSSYFPVTVFNINNYLGTTLSGRLIITTNAENNILAHELGHLIGNLDDEYTGGGASINATNIASSATVGTNKWGQFIPPLGTPVSVDSVFVPSSTCKMGATIGNSFCLVCSNELNRVFFETAGITNVITTLFNFQTLRIGP